MQTALLILHLIGGSIWAGGHLVLAIGFLPPALRRRDPSIIQGFEARFEPIGLTALGLQVITGVLLLAPHVEGFGSESPLGGHLVGVIGAKFVLLLATIGLAAHARLRLIPRLKPETLGFLGAHIIAVTVLAVLFIVVGVAFPDAGG
ncbi:MAG: CopD family protein [Phycisphaerales bacterium JB039]